MQFSSRKNTHGSRNVGELHLPAILLLILYPLKLVLLQDGQEPVRALALCGDRLELVNSFKYLRGPDHTRRRC